MTQDELAATRAKHLDDLQALRSAIVPYLFHPDKKQRQGAAARVRRLDAKIRRWGGTVEDEGDEFLETLIAPAQPGRRLLL